MKHLTKSAAIILSALMTLSLVFLSLVAPSAAVAGGIEYTDGAGSTEGDPGDGLEYSGGGGGTQIVSDKFETYEPFFGIEIQIILGLSNEDIILICLPQNTDSRERQLLPLHVILREASK